MLRQIQQRRRGLQLGTYVRIDYREQGHEVVDDCIPRLRRWKREPGASQFAAG